MLRRIAGKTVVSILRSDVINSVCSVQVCAGHEAGCEAAIHAMHSIFKEEETEAVLLVDAVNAFNSINRQVFLHNISKSFEAKYLYFNVRKLWEKNILLPPQLYYIESTVYLNLQLSNVLKSLKPSDYVA